MPQLSLHTPVGDLTVSEEAGDIVAVDWGWGRDQTETALLIQARDRLHAYFDGDASPFGLPLAPRGTDYQRRVWEALCRIPYGATRSYRDIACEAGGVARSVGQANGRNPIPIFIPCHRVVGTADFGGYSGGDGLATKRILLDLERGQVSAGPMNPPTTPGPTTPGPITPGPITPGLMTPGKSARS